MRKSVGLLREVKDRPLRPGLSLSTVAAFASVTHPTQPCQPQAWEGCTARDRDDATTPVASRAVIGLGGDSKPRSQLGHPDTSLRARGTDPPFPHATVVVACSEALPSGRPRQPPWGWWCCSAMQCRRRCNVLAPAVDEEFCLALTLLLQARFALIFEQ